MIFIYDKRRETFSKYSDNYDNPAEDYERAYSRRPKKYETPKSYVKEPKKHVTPKPYAKELKKYVTPKPYAKEPKKYVTPKPYAKEPKHFGTPDPYMKGNFYIKYKKRDIFNIIHITQ